MIEKTLRDKASSSSVWQQAVPFLGLVLVCIFFQIATKGKLISTSNFKAFSNYAFQMVIPACGAVFLMAQGQLDFSMAGNVCICCILAAKASYINPWLAPVVAVLVGITLGRSMAARMFFWAFLHLWRPSQHRLCMGAWQVLF